ncbi:diguanylate cyclase [Colwellia sp. MEBiC06753]
MQTILAVDDAKDTLILLEFDLQAEGYQVLTAHDGESAIELLNQQNVDLLLLDMYMPGLSGLETLKQVNNNPKLVNLPVIMLSASDDEDEIVSALEYGAHDYVTKPYIAKVLLARIKNALRLREKTLTLENLAKTDYLTGVNNKGQFEQLAKKAISQTARNGNQLAIAMLDIDHFKSVNDTYGHEAGDIVLKQFAKLLEITFRDYDIIGRVGGEEFAVCMPDTELVDAFNACERFRTALEACVIELNQGNSISVTVSVGLTAARHADCAYDFDSLMQTADKFLYQAKEASRNTVISHEKLIDNDTIKSVAELAVEPIDTPEEKLPGIDYQIGVNNVLGDDNLYNDILQMFYDDHHLDGDTIRQAIIYKDPNKLKHVVHTLKGVACSIGAMQLFENAKQLDIAVNNNDEGRYLSLYENVSYELQRVLKGIKQILPNR